jgi:hypothetical protein
VVPGGAAVLRVLLVLRVEVVDGVRHDVPKKYQCCGSGMFIPEPGSGIRDPEKIYSGSRTRIRTTAKYHKNTLPILIRVLSKLKGGFCDFFFFMYDIQHCFICRPSDSTVSEDAEIEPRTVATKHWL